MSDLILGVDAGNYMAKVAGPYGIDSYRTAICEWFERNIVETFGDDDMEFEIAGRRGFAGTIAEYEDIFGASGMYGDSKAHEDTKIRVLLAIHRYIEKYCPNTQTVSLVTGQPITSHIDSEKEKIQEMLQGRHEFTVNGNRQVIYIDQVRVGAEGTGAFWSQPENGTVRIIDVGSGTINAATVKNKKVVNTESGTFNFGMETLNVGLDSVARGVVRETTRLRWKNTDQVYVCGGVASDILPHIQEHYSSAKLIQPLLKRMDGVEVARPVFANAIGFYTLGKGVFG